MPVRTLTPPPHLGRASNRSGPPPTTGPLEIKCRVFLAITSILYSLKKKESEQTKRVWINLMVETGARRDYILEA